MISIGAQLRNVREAHDMSQPELASAVNRVTGWNWHQTTVAKIESGERDVKVRDLIAYADLFGKSLDELAGRVPLTPPQQTVIAVERAIAAIDKVSDQIRQVRSE